MNHFLGWVGGGGGVYTKFSHVFLQRFIIHVCSITLTCACSAAYVICRLCYNVQSQLPSTVDCTTVSAFLCISVAYFYPRGGLCKWTVETPFPHLTCLKICIACLAHTYIREVLSSGIFRYLHLDRLYSCSGLTGVPFKSRDQLSFIKLYWMSRGKESLVISIRTVAGCCGQTLLPNLCC